MPHILKPEEGHLVETRRDNLIFIRKFFKINIFYKIIRASRVYIVEALGKKPYKIYVSNNAPNFTTNNLIFHLISRNYRKFCRSTEINQ
ncbi:hypothetical protein BpHYR1_047732 [Brachionus plicatilis]|uniref:Uncharacterized protein n=1 Tax=Brachionus plicatilis TaxID=10195 RepID=A0A3M7NZN8_BRAPC|nr:hypothetical protein BpHYR1_047732 [Brachionus plicatilis]